jgi:hypothetical protein
MITGRAMLSWPVSAVTSRVARDATDNDSQRRLRDSDPTFCEEIIEKIRRASLDQFKGSMFTVQG